MNTPDDMAFETSPCFPAGDDAAAEAAYYRRVLQELTELGMALARRIAAVPCATPEAADQMAAAFERISRTVRRTVRLAEWLREQAAAKPARADTTREQARADARKRIVRRVEDDLHSAARRGRCEEGMREELVERLEALDVMEDIDRGRPVDEIIEEISRDLGLKGSHYQRRSPADVAALCAWAAASPGAGAAWTGAAGGRESAVAGLPGGRREKRVGDGRGAAADTS